MLGADSPEVWEGSAGAHAELMDATRELMMRGQEAGVIRDDVAVLDIPILMWRGVRHDGRRTGPSRAADWRRHLELVLLEAVRAEARSVAGLKPAYLIHGEDDAKIDEWRRRVRRRAEAEHGPGGLELFDARRRSRPRTWPPRWRCCPSPPAPATCWPTT